MSEKLSRPEYPHDAEGYVDWLYVSHGEFGRDMYTSYAYLHGRQLDAHPPLGLGLRVRGDRTEFPHSAQLHIDDVPEFAERVRCFERLCDGFVRDDEGHLQPLTQAEIDASVERLAATGIEREEVIQTVLERRSTTMNHQILSLSWFLGDGS